MIRELEGIPVSVKTMRDIVPDGVDVYVYSQLKGKTRQNLFKNKRGVVILIPKKNSSEGHFVCLLPRKTHIEYFSSLGNSFETELAMLNQVETHFHKIVGKHYIYNRVKLQSGKYSIKTCAQFVYARLCLYKLKLREFVQLFQRDVHLSSPDDVVSMMALLRFTL